jgi:formate-dependent phosphoribosylglycinamide formyltransferase (GAR transformylase)
MGVALVAASDVDTARKLAEEAADKVKVHPVE